MNATLRKVLVISGKQAIGALLGNGVLAGLLPHTFNFHDKAGMMAFATSTLSLVLAAEGKVWIPKLLAWANSPTNGD